VVTHAAGERGRTAGRSPDRYGEDMAMTDVDVGAGMIRLAQLLKLAGVIDSGGEAKLRIAAGEVSVNGQVELRRGRQLGHGDVVEFADRRLRIRAR
jgi:ribosome-associated protein